MKLLERLARLNTNVMQLDEAIELSVEAEALREGYKRHQIPSPVILDDSIRLLDRHIADQSRDRLEMELREINAADAADLTSAERRAIRKTRRDELEARLGKNAAV